MFKSKLDWGLVPALLALLASSLAEAGVYKCTDDQGRTYYQDKPCQNLTAARLPSSLSKMANSEENVFLWRAQGGKGTLYLLGSPHFGSQNMYPLPQKITDAFSASNAMVVEADLEALGSKDLADATRGTGRYTDKTTLENHIKPVTWNKVVEMGKRLEISEDSLRELKPWLAAFTLANESLKKSGYSHALGIGKVFLKEAQGHKPVLQIENLNEQIMIVDGLNDLEQEQLLLQTLKDLGHAAELYKSIAEAWKKGDAEAMELITRQSFDSGDVGSKLLKLFYEDRNERMVNRLKEMVSDDRIYFVVVGAGHLGGEKGMLKLLRDKGFTISQP